MQLPPDPEDHPLTPRMELWEDGAWFTQLHDMNAKVACSDKNGVIRFEASGRLLDDAQREPARGKSGFSLIYQFEGEMALISANAPGVGAGDDRPRLVLPLISPNHERVAQTAPGRIEIHKSGGIVVIEANVPLEIRKTSRSRIFNLVPGFEAVPIVAQIPPDGSLEVRLRVGR